MMIIKFPHLKGYVEVIEGEIVTHGDPELKYMKKLIEKAELWAAAWNEVDEPDNKNLSFAARATLERARLSGYAMERFNERVKKQILSGKLDREKIIDLWEGWLRQAYGNGDTAREVAVFLADWQEYNILKGE